MKISVIGTGYVGLVTGTCLAESGAEVLCIDIDENKVQKMKSGEVPIYEPHLDVYFERNIRQNRLSFSTSLREAVDNTDIIFLALPTPPGEDGSADLSYVLGVAKEIGSMMNEYKIIVDKSTVPVGTAEKVSNVISQELNERFNDSERPGFDVVSNPEFLREGFAVDDFMKPDRVVIGCSSEKARVAMEKLYKPFVRSGNPLLFMDEKSAELTKYAANAFLATKITFMNEIANLCERVGANVDMVRLGIGSDDRIGKRFLFPGIGYGGSCFPKDVQAIVKSAGEVGYKLRILSEVMNINHDQKTIIVDKIIDKYGSDLKGKTVAIWGLSFKPDTDDIREAPAIYVIERLKNLGAKIQAFDPEAMNNFSNQIDSDIDFKENLYEALEGADFLVICTEWQVFRNPDFQEVSNRLNEKVIFDGRNIFDLEEMKELNFYYASIGRQLITPK